MLLKTKLNLFRNMKCIILWYTTSVSLYDKYCLYPITYHCSFYFDVLPPIICFPYPFTTPRIIILIKYIAILNFRLKPCSQGCLVRLIFKCFFILVVGSREFYWHVACLNAFVVCWTYLEWCANLNIPPKIGSRPLHLPWSNVFPITIIIKSPIRHTLS